MEEAALGTQLDGAPRAGGPPPRHPSREPPRRSETFRMGPPEGARGRGRGGNRGARLGPLPVGPAPRGCDWGPRVGWVARDSGLRGAGRSVEPDSGAERSGLRSGAFSGTGAARMPSPGTLPSASLPPAGAQPGGRCPWVASAAGLRALVLRCPWRRRGHLRIGA